MLNMVLLVHGAVARLTIGMVEEQTRCSNCETGSGVGRYIVISYPTCLSGQLVYARENGFSSA